LLFFCLLLVISFVIQPFYLSRLFPWQLLQACYPLKNCSFKKLKYIHHSSSYSLWRLMYNLTSCLVFKTDDFSGLNF
jgi:hypothetical protein